MVQRSQHILPPPKINECHLERDHFKRKYHLPTIIFQGTCYPPPARQFDVFDRLIRKNFTWALIPKWRVHVFFLVTPSHPKFFCVFWDSASGPQNSHQNALDLSYPPWKRSHDWLDLTIVMFFFLGGNLLCYARIIVICWDTIFSTPKLIYPTFKRPVMRLELAKRRHVYLKVLSIDAYVMSTKGSQMFAIWVVLKQRSHPWCMTILINNWVRPRKSTWHLKIDPWKRNSYWKPSFLGSILVFGGVVRFHPIQKISKWCFYFQSFF